MYIDIRQTFRCSPSHSSSLYSYYHSLNMYLYNLVANGQIKFEPQRRRTNSNEQRPIRFRSLFNRNNKICNDSINSPDIIETMSVCMCCLSLIFAFSNVSTSGMNLSPVVLSLPTIFGVLFFLSRSMQLPSSPPPLSGPVSLLGTPYNSKRSCRLIQLPEKRILVYWISPPPLCPLSFPLSFTLALCIFLCEFCTTYNFLEFFEKCSDIYNHNDRYFQYSTGIL